MNVIAWFIRVLARCLEIVGAIFSRTARVLYGLLPVLLKPDQLSRHIQACYDTIYDIRRIATRADIDEQDLEPWESDVLNRYQIRSGRMLVMGSGWGREALAVARRGMTVVGVDTNKVAVRTSQRLARTTDASAAFLLADFMQLPYVRACFDFALLSSTMYSAIPGTAERQAWLADLGRRLKPGGLAILSFAFEQYPQSRTNAFCNYLNATLCKLPGTNHAYQPGDDYSTGHFLHNFRNEEELRAELAGAGVRICELNWANGYAVVMFPEPPQPEA